jgi:HEAT repeat protein
VLGTLEELATDANRDVRWHAFEALCHLHAPPAIDPLVAGLADEDAAIRWAAARGLAAAGEPALIPVLEALVRREPGQQFHRAARRVLARLPAPGHEEELTALVESLGHLTTVVESGPRAELLLLELR